MRISHVSALLAALALPVIALRASACRNPGAGRAAAPPPR